MELTKQPEKSWSQRALESIRRDRKETEAKYGIKFGKTEIYCARCGRPWGFGRHTCFDLALKSIRDQKEKELESLKGESAHLLTLLRDNFGPQKASHLLEIPETTINHWIQIGKIPKRHLLKVSQMLKPA